TERLSFMLWTSRAAGPLICEAPGGRSPVAGWGTAAGGWADTATGERGAGSTPAPSVRMGRWPSPLGCTPITPLSNSRRHYAPTALGSRRNSSYIAWANPALAVSNTLMSTPSSTDKDARKITASRRPGHLTTGRPPRGRTPSLRTVPSGPRTPQIPPSPAAPAPAPIPAPPRGARPLARQPTGRDPESRNRDGSSAPARPRPGRPALGGRCGPPRLRSRDDRDGAGSAARGEWRRD